MLPSAAATESRLPIRGNPRNEIAGFQGFNLEIFTPTNHAVGSFAAPPHFAT
jgi:hypothetical protein